MNDVHNMISGAPTLDAVGLSAAKPLRPLARLEGVSVVRDRRMILTDVDFKLNDGDFVAITGPNGGGKTTLLKVILKLMSPTTGTVRYYSPDGSVVDRLSIGYLPQKTAIDAHFPIDVRQVIASGLIADRKMSKADRSERVAEMLRVVELTEHASKAIGVLSGGQLQRALLGRALISDPKVLVLDEPLSYIDKHFERHIYDIIERIAPGRTVLLVSHEMSTIAEMANRHIIVDHTIHDCHSARHFARMSCDYDVDGAC